MKIGIITNADSFIPLAHTLAAQNLQVYVFFKRGPDAWANQQAEGFLQATANIKATTGTTEDDLYTWMFSAAPNICFVFNYADLIDTSRIPTTIKDIFNIHSGPLPSYRGPVPVFWQLKNGEPFVTVCIHRLTAKFDDGPVVWSKQLPRQPHFTYTFVNQLFNHVCVEGALYIIQNIWQGKTLSIQKTGSGLVKYYKRPVLKDVMINWQTMCADEICNLVNAGNAWNKGALTSFQNRELKIMDARKYEGSVVQDTPAGMIFEIKDRFVIACINNESVSVNMIFYSETFIAAYRCGIYGFTINQRLGS